MQTKKICLNGKWFFQAVESFDKKVYGFSVPSLWTHGECWGYPDSWSQVKQAWIWRKITIPDEWKNFRIVLKFEAVMLKAEVFLDNTKIGEHTGGFTPFEIDLSDIAKTFNKNSCELRVLVTSAKYAEQGQKLIHQIGYPENYEEGCLPGGIWQSIWLIALPQVHFGNWHYNSYISKNKLEFFIKIHNVSTQKFNGYVKCLFLNNQNKKFFPDKNIKITSGNKIAIKFNKPIDKLPLWSSSLPNLLKIIFVLIDSNGKLIHKLPVRIGLREFSIKQDKFLLNGKPIHLLGYSLIRHRVSPHWWREDYVRTIFRFIKKLGFNHIRTHAAICPEVILKVADEEGILIQDQSSLWSTGQSGYFLGGPTLLQNSKREFKEWIERDRNHPSVIIWDVENELIRINARNTSLVNELIDFVKTIDSTRPVVASGAGAHKHSDFYHQHCERGLTKIIDFWAKQHRNKPFVAGEWWADATKLSMNTTHFGVNNLKRYPAEFKSQDDIHRKFGQLYRDEIIAHRIRGVAGTVLFGMDSLFFKPWWTAKTHLNIGVDAKHKLCFSEEKVTFPYPERYKSTCITYARWPFVNPGWVKNAPKVIPNTSFTKPIKEGLTPILSAFKEQPHNVWSNETIKKTLVIVNDTTEFFDKEIFICINGKKVWNSRIKVQSGCIANTNVALTMPSVDCICDITITIHWLSHKHRLCNIKVYPESIKVNTFLQNSTISISGISKDSKIVSYLSKQNVNINFLNKFPESPCLWIIGKTELFGLDYKQIVNFLNNGGRILLLRQEINPNWMPSALGFLSAVSTACHTILPFGIPHLSKELTSIDKVEILAPEHILFKNEVDCIGPWRYGDGRIADDLYKRPIESEQRHTGPLTILTGGTGIDNISLAEISFKNSCIIQCQLYLEENIEIDPQATQLFNSILKYLLEPNLYKLSSVITNKSLSKKFKREFNIPVKYSNVFDSKDLFIITDTNKISEYLKNLDNKNSFINKWVRSGGKLLMLLPSEKNLSKIGKWRCICTENTNYITSILNRDSVIAGWSSADVNFWKTGIPASQVLSLESSNGKWRDAIALFEHINKTLWGGATVEKPLGSLLKFVKLGEGIAIITTLALTRWKEPKVFHLWESLFTNLDVPIKTLPKSVEKSSKYVNILKTKPLPLDGDYFKWACDEPDQNIAPWQHATPIVLNYSLITNDTPKEDMDISVLKSRNYGALGYLLWDENYLYTAMLSIAPDHDLEDHQLIYKKSAMEIFVGPFQIILSRKSNGKLDIFLARGFKKEDEVKIQGSVHLIDKLLHWRDLSLLSLSDKEKLTAYFIEAAIPWQILEVHKPQEGRKFPIAFGVDFGNNKTRKLHFSFFYPYGYRWNDLGTFATGVLVK